MKVTHWWKKLSAAIVAAGILMPSAASAVNITLGDPSFENYGLPTSSPGAGYAYANLYRPLSDWVDDPDSPGPPTYTQDDSKSNWLYNASYAESASGARKRAAPHSGMQAMHGFFRYSGQETLAPAVFEANSRYEFSIWAQGDDDSTGSSSRVFLYFYDGSMPFSQATSLVFKRFGQDTGDFNNRVVGMTQGDSQMNWRKITLGFGVGSSSPLIGKPIGVAFWAADDAGLDDATLTSVPEPMSVILVGVGAAGLSLFSVRRRK